MYLLDLFQDRDVEGASEQWILGLEPLALVYSNKLLGFRHVGCCLWELALIACCTVLEDPKMRRSEIVYDLNLVVVILDHSVKDSPPIRRGQ